MKAATGEEVTAEELGGADVHTRLSGVADYFAEDDAHALRLCRTIVSTLHTTKRLPADMTAVEDPKYDPAELYGIVNADIRKPYDVREIIARLVDGSRFDEFKARYGDTLVTGFARLHGFLVGIIANNGVLFSESALKATHFIELCNLRGIPLMFLQNITGLHRRPAVRARRHREGRRQDGARRRELGRAEVHGRHRRIVRRRQLRHVRPRLRSADAVDVAERADFGDGRRTGGRRADDGEARAGRTRRAARCRRDEEAAIRQPILAQYEHEGSPYYSTARLWDDGVIDPVDTRSMLALGLSAAYNAPIPDPRFGVFRM